MSMSITDNKSKKNVIGLGRTYNGIQFTGKERRFQRKTMAEVG